MFGAWRKMKIDEDTINAFIDFLDDNPSIKSRFLLKMLDRKTVIDAVVDIFSDKENEISRTFMYITDRKFKKIEDHLDEVIDRNVKAIDVNKRIAVEIDKSLQGIPELKTLKELGRALKESIAVNTELRDFLKKSTITTVIEQTKGATK